MSFNLIHLQINKFKSDNIASRKAIASFAHESPLVLAKRNAQEQLSRNLSYRASILKNVGTFANMTQEALISAALSMDEAYYKKGDQIIIQDEIGDTFYLVEEGLVSVTRKFNMDDPDEIPKELVQLGKNNHFGEIALLTAEPRSATVTVISEYCKCLRMSHQTFDELLSTTKKLETEGRRSIARDVIDMIPLFNPLGIAQKKRLVDAMTFMSFKHNSYICRQGSAGNAFFIITEGFCKVTVTLEDGTEKEVGKLRAGDFFGEVVLITDTNKRTANVISMEDVSCLSLSRNDFNTLLKALKMSIEIFQHERAAKNPYGKKVEDKTKTVNLLAKKRRITALNTNNQTDEARVINLFRRIGKFTTECLWNSLYSRLWREMLLDSDKMNEYGSIVINIMMETIEDSRYVAVNKLAKEINRILELDPSRRSQSEHACIVGLMKQTNTLKSEFCTNWLPYQYTNLCRKVKFLKVKAFCKVYDINTAGTVAYLILRGAVRLYSKRSFDSNDTVIEQDLFPGELFGETTLSGIFTRLRTAQAITDVELVVIEYADYLVTQDKDTLHLSIEDRVSFLYSMSVFKLWDSFRLIRLAQSMHQHEISRGSTIVHVDTVSKDIQFIVSGRVDVIKTRRLANSTKTYVVASLCKGDMIGETSLINKFSKNNKKVVESFSYIAYNTVDILTLPGSAFALIDLKTLETIKTCYNSKIDWRKQRASHMKYERAKLRMFMKSNMSSNNEILDAFSDSYNSCAIANTTSNDPNELESTAAGVGNSYSRSPSRDISPARDISPTRSVSPTSMRNIGIAAGNDENKNTLTTVQSSIEINSHPLININRPQSAVNRPQSAVSFTQSAVNRPQSAVSFTQSAINRPQSAVSLTQPAVNRPQSAVSFTQSAINRPQSAVSLTQPVVNRTQNIVNLPQSTRPRSAVILAQSTVYTPQFAIPVSEVPQSALPQNLNSQIFRGVMRPHSAHPTINTSINNTNNRNISVITKEENNNIGSTHKKEEGKALYWPSFTSSCPSPNNHIQSNNNISNNNNKNDIINNTSFVNNNKSKHNKRPSYLKDRVTSDGKLKDFEDIPEILAQDMDFFMASINFRTERERQLFSKSISSALKPKTARILNNNARILSESPGPLIFRNAIKLEYAKHNIFLEKSIINQPIIRSKSANFVTK